MTLAFLIASKIVGWIYFLAWSVSFYPQLVENFFRKRVDGYSFDYLIYNLTGFAAYTLFNTAFFFSHKVHREYRHKKNDYDATIPVQANDVVFAIHALVLTSILGLQILYYPKNGQRVSKTCWIITALLWLFSIVNIILGLSNVTTWLFSLQMVAYVKIAVTLIKYIPQAWLNFRRKSTVGWNIDNVLLDFTGGSFSILQQLMDAIHNSDWGMFTGDLPKTLLGLESMVFDVLFMVQHYILYRNAWKAFENETIVDPEDDEPSINSENEDGLTKKPLRGNEEDSSNETV
eukprot:gb/GECH01009835.1/.p1 GENE.gb/GECH01009835.1/~~gb/GECH01009835.1/.p1  ORF type:complete len:289 (+),score=54.06 gb/GECH01009835.1/:1-867(+)